MRPRTRNAANRSRQSPRALRQAAQSRHAPTTFSGQKVVNQPMRGGVAVDELRSNALRVQQMNERERVFDEPDVSPCAIQMELSLSTTEGVRYGSDVDLFGRREHHLWIFHRHAGRHPMDEHIRWAKCSPPDVGIRSQSFSELPGISKTLICSKTVLTSSRN